MKVNKPYMLVHISKEAQIAKREKIGSIYIPPVYAFMAYNLQCGVIVQIGEKVQQNFPDARPGDIALFHHTIEEEDSRLIETLSNKDEIRYVNASSRSNQEIFGILKEDGTLIASENHVFLSKMVTPIKKRIVSELMAVDEDMWDDPDRLREYQESLGEQIKSLEETLEHTTDKNYIIQIEQDIAAKQYEREKINKFLNAPKLVHTKVLYINKKTSRETTIKPGDRVVIDASLAYPIDFQGEKFIIAQKDFVFAKWNA